LFYILKVYNKVKKASTLKQKAKKQIIEGKKQQIICLNQYSGQRAL